MAFTNQIADTQAYEFIVAPVGTFSRYATVQEAIDDAVAQGYNEVTPTTVLLKSGTYTENLVLHPGINIQGGEEGSTILLGVHTPPTTGFVVFRDLILQSASDVLLDAATAGTADITFDNCSFNINGYIVNTPNWTGNIIIDECNDTSVTNGIVNNAGGSLVEVKDSSLGAGLLKFATSGITKIINSRIFISLDIQNATVIECGSYLEGVLTVDGSNAVFITNSRINSGIASALIISPTFTDTVFLANTTITTSNVTAIDGTGSIELCSVDFSDSNTIAGTITYANNSSFNATKGKFRTLLEIEDGVLRANGTDPDDGMVLIGNTATNKPVWASIISSDGSVAFTAGAGTLDMRVSGGADWHEVTTDTAMVATDGYSVKSALGVPAVMTLPVTAAFGTIIEITGNSTDLYTIVQNASQQIQWDGLVTTLGAGGSLQSTQPFQSIKLLCVEADLIWNVLSSTGNFTIV
jgi:hypothetical protein